MRWLLILFIVGLGVLLAVEKAPICNGRVLGQEASQVLALLNDYRSDNGVAPVVSDARLSAAAVWMVNDMVTNDYFSHTDSLGRDPFQRMADFGYSYNTWRGENLAAAVGPADEVLKSWQDSPVHNEILLWPAARVVGVARAQGGSLGWYWALELAGAAPVSVIAPPSPTSVPTPVPTPPPLTPTPAPSVTPCNSQ